MRNKLVYGKWVFEDREITGGSLVKEASLASSSLAADTFTVGIKSLDRDIIHFVADTPLTYFHRGRQKGVCYLQSVVRTGPDRYALSGVSAVGLLAKRTHSGGIYTGQTVGEVVGAICGSVPVLVKSNLASVALYGWLPYAPARDNLSQVLFAVGADLGTDLRGVLRVEPLWNGISGTVAGGRQYTGGRVEYGAAVSAVAVTEHQYTQGGEERELFNGTALAGDLITFDAPMHSLRASGFALLSSGANWARLSAGTGVLTGRAYRHTTRQITEPVTAGAAEHVKPVPDATLVSLVNSRAVARRLAAYYRCRETLEISVVSGAERPGHVVSVYHPYDRRMVPACISGAATVMSATLKSDLTALMDFRPPQPEDEEYYDERVVLTGAGAWTRPVGVSSVRYALISAAQGGGCGGKGGDAGESPSVSWTDPVWHTTYSGCGMAPGGAGGAGGIAGEGGRVAQGELDVSGMDALPYQCGAGSGGAAYSETAAPAAQGGETTLGALSTAGASAPPGGYADAMTGERYGGTGEAGTPGGRGAGKAAEVTAIDADTVQRFDAAGDAAAGQIWPGGHTPVTAEDPGKVDMAANQYQHVRIWRGCNLGSGAAAGVPGTAGNDYGSCRTGDSTVTVTASDGLDGAAAAITPAKADRYGRGGRGGYGGGGGSSGGLAIGNADDGAQVIVNAGHGGTGGAGGAGGDGGDGCVILYYRRPKPWAGAGPLAAPNHKWLLDGLGRRMIV